jgi:ribosomal protein S24E
MKDLKIIKQRENHLFNRKEIEVNIESDVAPKMKEAEEFIAKEFSSHAENVKIKKIKGRFGSNNFVIFASVYHSKEDKDKIEPKSKKEKKAEADNKQAKSEEKKE